MPDPRPDVILNHSQTSGSEPEWFITQSSVAAPNQDCEAFQPIGYGLRVESETLPGGQLQRFVMPILFANAVLGRLPQKESDLSGVENAISSSLESWPARPNRVARVHQP